jgi:hypothetical protein
MAAKDHVGWWKRNGRYVNVPASKIHAIGGSNDPKLLAAYRRRQTHPVLIVDQGGGHWVAADGNTTVRARQGKRVYGYVVPAAKVQAASGGCLMMILTLGLYRRG